MPAIWSHSQIRCHRASTLPVCLIHLSSLIGGQMMVLPRKWRPLLLGERSSFEKFILNAGDRFAWILVGLVRYWWGSKILEDSLFWDQLLYTRAGEMYSVEVPGLITASSHLRYCDPSYLSWCQLTIYKTRKSDSYLEHPLRYKISWCQSLNKVKRSHQNSFGWDSLVVSHTLGRLIYSSLSFFICKMSTKDDISYTLLKMLKQFLGVKFFVAELST